MIEFLIHLRMAEKKINQLELSKATGIGKNSINRYYNNTCDKITKEHLNILCEYFDCEIQDIITFKKD
ncbi:helix-turn-helix domain-containing protein [Clostridium perfringens]|uniref:helix-turn-helix domain-containing protein n=1 Tax=Clostridium perfringens TaxID=1502 RepID=UPI001E5D6A7F|nr:helix-turn-helix transcriptional regulator [Clostridium perfringens]MCC5421368.1 helix-turn-helix transcriptional regulator [Clostridium perfringens]MCC5430826.1 helix-turn-helix transcriptional regulator [Clostridium perfringens]MCC5445298.1 helix-turn-helix transcriptional regulator [Clostridium perfringens]MCC5448273.1 helix-turn-helix transcriptional regulator [Clostridium perfringens]MDK0792757.1 helix-turn-helix transcriptional regulator [Clostridium perfringens]